MTDKIEFMVGRKKERSCFLFFLIQRKFHFQISEDGSFMKIKHIFLFSNTNTNYFTLTMLIRVYRFATVVEIQDTLSSSWLHLT